MRCFLKHILLFKRFRLHIKCPDLTSLHVTIHTQIKTTRSFHYIIVNIHQPIIFQTPQIEMCLILLCFIQSHYKTFPFRLHQINCVFLQVIQPLFQLLGSVRRGIFSIVFEQRPIIFTLSILLPFEERIKLS